VAPGPRPACRRAIRDRAGAPLLWWLQRVWASETHSTDEAFRAVADENGGLTCVIGNWWNALTPIGAFLFYALGDKASWELL
jgi:hypothetical protein